MATKAKEREGDAAVAAPAATPSGPSQQAVSGEAGIGIADGLSKLREPFAPHHISKLPKPLKRDAAKGRCNECGGYHGLPAIHLDYVGHAALTDRLLDVDPFWNWEPMGWNPDGTPALDRNGGLWIKLTVCGVTRPGYGCADGKSGGDAIKEIIGDALRNAAMRFGAALDLWHKGELHPEEADEGHSEKGERAVSPPASDLKDKLEKSVEQGKHDARKDPWSKFYSGRSALHKGLGTHSAELIRLGDEGTSDDLDGYLTSPEYVDFIAVAGEHAPHYLEGGPPAPEEFVGIFKLEQIARDKVAMRGGEAADNAPLTPINAG